jgi:type IV fimbrial biogenesis protein FimT
MKTTLNTLATRRHQTGLTLVECAITTTVLAVVAGLTVPAFETARERRHLEGAAAQLETDLMLSRSLAVARNEAVRMGFERDADTGTSCYVVHTGAAGDCSCTANGSAVCSNGAEALRSVRYGAEMPLAVTSNSRSILFDPVRGTITPTATVRVTGSNGGAIHQVINIMGRVRSCSPAPALAGYATC